MAAPPIGRRRAFIFCAASALALTSTAAVASEGQQQAGFLGLFAQQQHAQDSEASSAAASSGCGGEGADESSSSRGGQQQLGLLALYGQQQQGSAESSAHASAGACGSSTSAEGRAHQDQQQTATLGLHRQEQGGASSAGSHAGSGCQEGGETASSSGAGSASSGQQQSGFLGLAPQQQYENGSTSSSRSARSCGGEDQGSSADADDGGQQQAGFLGTTQTAGETSASSCTAGAVDGPTRTCVVGGQQQDEATQHQQQCTVGARQRRDADGLHQRCLVGAQQQGGADGGYQDSCMVLAEHGPGRSSCLVGAQHQDRSGQRADAPGAQQQNAAGQQQTGLFGHQQQGRAGQQQSGLLGLHHQQQRAEEPGADEDRRPGRAPDRSVGEREVHRPQDRLGASPSVRELRPRDAGASASVPVGAALDEVLPTARGAGEGRATSTLVPSDVTALLSTQTGRGWGLRTAGSLVVAVVLASWVVPTGGRRRQRNRGRRDRIRAAVFGADATLDSRTRALGVVVVVVFAAGVISAAMSEPVDSAAAAVGSTPEAAAPAPPSVLTAPTAQDRPTGPVEPVAARPSSEDDALVAAVRAALDGNGRLSRHVLWHNAVPSWATESTRGPALASLHRAAQARRAEGVRVRARSEEPEIVRIEPGPDGVVVTARIHSEATVHRGSEVGQPVSTSETVDVQLRQFGLDLAYVVWAVG